MPTKSYITYIPADRRFDFGQTWGTQLRFYYKWELKPGDTLRWFTENFKGIAGVLSRDLDECGRVVYTITMISKMPLANAWAD